MAKENPIDRFLRTRGITDPALAAKVRRFAKKQEKRFLYRVDTPKWDSAVELAVIQCEVDVYGPPKYRAAVKCRDGRIGLFEGTKEETDKNYPAAASFEEDAQILLDEIYGWRSPKQFYGRIDGTIMGFAEKKGYQGRYGYNFPGSLLHIGIVPERKHPQSDRAVNLFNSTMRYSLELNIFGDMENDPAILETGDYYGMRAAITRVERQRFHEAQAAFTALLDPEILAACKKTGIMTAGAYNWLAGDGDPEKKRYRVQAAHAYSLFFRQLIELTDAIDKGIPLKPLLADKLGQKTNSFGSYLKPSLTIRENTVQRLQRHFNPRTDLQCLPWPGQLWQALDGLPAEWWPKNGNAEDFAIVWNAAEELEKMGGGGRNAVLRSCRGAWEKNAALVAEKLPYTGHAILRIEDTGIKDYFMRLYHVLYLPLILQQAEQRKFAPIESWLKYISNHITSSLFEDSTIKTVLDLNKLWHDRLRTITAQTEDLKVGDKTILTGGLSWEPLTAPVTAPNGIRIIPLTTSAELKEEGDRMHNCIGGYTYRCHTGNDFILSLRDAGGKRISSLCLTENGRKLKNTEHRGLSNSTPSPEAATAAQWYLQEIEEGRIKPDWDAIHAARSKAKQELEDVRNRENLAQSLIETIGFDPYNRDKCAAAFEIYKPFLPKRWQGMDYATWLEKTGAEQMARAVVEGQIAWEKEAQKTRAAAARKTPALP